MNNLIVYLFVELFTYPIILYIHSSMLELKINFKKPSTYLGTVFFTIINYLNFTYMDGFLRFFVSTIILMISSYAVFEYKIDKIFVSVILQQLLFFISEIGFALITLILHFDLDNFMVLQHGIIISNYIIALLGLILYKVPFINRGCKFIIVFLDKIDGIIKYIIVLFFIATLNILLMSIYFDSNNKFIILINIGFIIIYSIIVFQSINEKSENIKFKQENGVLLDNLNEYEKMLDYQRVNNHENKNQLLVIRSMISKNNKKALKYIDEIITEKRKDDEGLYTYAKIIPEGGLQGLVYQKMLKMKENDINIVLNVDRKIRKINFDEISSKTNYDLCRASGIILDNAIEEVIKLDDKEVLISMYKDNNDFVIEVSNKCETIPDLSKLDDKGYTTKTDGHGYGLSLLKEIVSNNDDIENEKSISKDIFTQIIKIKM